MKHSFFLKRLLRLFSNFLLDMRYGGKFLGGGIPSRFQNEGAYATANSNISVLPAIFKLVPIHECDTIVDVGCGKGRPINWWLSQYLKNDIYGIELDETIADSIRKRLGKYSNVHIVSGDAVENIPKNATIFYLYNPFNADVLKRFTDALLLPPDNYQNAVIIYYNPVHINVFKDNPAWSVAFYDVTSYPELMELSRQYKDVHSFAIIKRHVKRNEK